MRFTNYLKQIQDVSIYPLISLIIFVAVFVIVAVYVFTADKKNMLMGSLMKELKGKADGTVVKEVVDASFA